MSGTTAPTPRSRNDFHIAIICALSIEAEMVELILDKDWAEEGITFGKAPNDFNTYTIGVIGGHNVVLAYMPSIGDKASAVVAVSLMTSYLNINVAFVVGICGAVPIHPVTAEEVILGDCIISREVLQYGVGHMYPTGFRQKTALEDTLQRAGPAIRGLMARETTSTNSARLRRLLLQHLEVMRQSHKREIMYPGVSKDRLFRPSYIHRHRDELEKCDDCIENGICTRSCSRLACSDSELISRKRLQLGEDAIPGASDPMIHFGPIGSANMVMKSGTERDNIAAGSLIGFEMEANGVWTIVPTITVKSACDYADSHKSKEWQGYAAATAAAGLKAFLERWDPIVRSELPVNPVSINLPETRLPHFVQRPAIMKGITAWLSSDGERPLVLFGMGGAGKSQLALETCQQANASKAYSTILWLDTTSKQTLEQNLVVIAGKLLNQDDVGDDIDKILSLIGKELQARAQKWLIVFDNYDNPKSFTESLSRYFPQAEQRHILVTSRHRSAGRLGQCFEVSQMSDEESLELLLQRTSIDPIERKHGIDIAGELGFLPLALDQAGSYIKTRDIPTRDFLDHYRVRKEQILREVPYIWEYRNSSFTDDSAQAQSVLLSTFTTWDLSLGQMQGDVETKRAKEQFLRISAFFDRTCISSRYFEAYCRDKTKPTDNWSRIFRTRGVWDHLNFREVVAEARELSLVLAKEGEASAFALHPMVQEGLKMRIPPEARQVMAEEFTEILITYIDYIHIPSNDLATRTEILANIDSCVASDSRLGWDEEKTVDASQYPIQAACGFSDVLRQAGRDEDSIRLGEMTLQACRVARGDANVKTLEMMLILARPYAQSGNFEKALQLREEASSKAKGNLPIGHRIACEISRDLALSYTQADKAEQAIRLLIRAQDMSEQYLGPNDVVTLACSYYLARVYREKNMDLEAERVCREALDRYEQLDNLRDERRDSVQDSLHPQKLTLTGLLGVVTMRLGKFDESETILKDALISQQAKLGLKHPLALSSKCSLADLYSTTNRTAQAKELYRTLLNEQKELLGADHVDTYFTQSQLAACLYNEGSYEEAEKLFERILRNQTKIHGENHDIPKALARNLSIAQKTLRESSSSPELPVTPLEPTRHSYKRL